MSAYRPFSTVEQAPPDPILGIVEQFKKDPNPRKVNLCIGVYQDASGHNLVLKSVKQAERMWLEQENSKDYLGMAGEDRYGQLVRELVFGKDHPMLKEGRVITLQTPGGTGALRVGAEFIHSQLPGAAVWISDPTWPNHRGIFQNAGMAVKTYAYYDAGRHALDFDALLHALEKVPEGDLVLLHACCHNPTGEDPTPEQWERIVAVFKRRAIIPFLDFAYQGFGDGMDRDAVGVRAFASAGLHMLVSSSFSKNFGLYRERVGALTVVAGDAAEAGRVMSRAKLTVRANYSTPPAHGGKVAEIVLSHPELRALWLSEVDGMRERIHHMRRLFVDSLKAKGVSRDFEFIVRQRGMFSFAGVSPAEVKALKERYGIYLVDNGRINVAAMTPSNMDYLATAIAAVLKG